MKKCSGCKLELPLSSFHKHVGRKFGVTEYCKTCRNERMIDKRYNLKPGQKQAILEKQNGVCGICKNPETSGYREMERRDLAIDHCHKTGTIRGLLCTNCNNGIGRFKDSIELLKNAVIYLQRIEDEKQ